MTRNYRSFRADNGKSYTDLFYLGATVISTQLGSRLELDGGPATCLAHTDELGGLVGSTICLPLTLEEVARLEELDEPQILEHAISLYQSWLHDHEYSGDISPMWQGEGWYCELVARELVNPYTGAESYSELTELFHAEEPEDLEGLNVISYCGDGTLLLNTHNRVAYIVERYSFNSIGYSKAKRESALEACLWELPDLDEVCETMDGEEFTLREDLEAMGGVDFARELGYELETYGGERTRGYSVERI